MINKTPFQSLLSGLKDTGNYRVFNDIVRERGDFPRAIWYGKYAIKSVVNWCSNDCVFETAPWQRGNFYGAQLYKIKKCRSASEILSP